MNEAEKAIEIDLELDRDEGQLEQTGAVGFPNSSRGEGFAHGRVSPSIQETPGTALVVVERRAVVPIAMPRLIADATGGVSAWDEFFKGRIRNTHTRAAYLRAVRRFSAWCDGRVPSLDGITPALVGDYLDQLKLSVPSQKVHLSAIRAFFDVLAQRHVVALNPAHSVRAERYEVVEGRTPAITVQQAKMLLDSIEAKSPIDLRDRALIAVLIYTAARAGAVAKLRRADLVDDGRRYSLQLAEKRGKARTIPVQEKLEKYLLEYLAAAGPLNGSTDAPLFPSAGGWRRQFSSDAMNGVDVCRMVKRRLKAAGLPTNLSPHSFRACVATDLLSQNVAIEEVQHLLGHADSRVTKLYDRRSREVTRRVVELISV